MNPEPLRQMVAGPEVLSVPGRADVLMDATPMRIKEQRITPNAETLDLIEPESTEELELTVRQLHSEGVSFTVVGAKSNVVGALSTGAATALSTRRLNGILSFDPVSQLITVGAGTMGGVVEQWLRERGFTLGQFPQSLNISTVGGWLSTRATGSHSARNGGIERSIRGATVILPDGRRMTFKPRVRPAGGLDALGVFIGSEGSLGVVAEVTFEVQRTLTEVAACSLFDGLDSVIEAQRELVQGGYPVALLRGYNVAESEHILGDYARGRCLLMASTIGPKHAVEGQLSSIREKLAMVGGIEIPPDSAERWYAERFDVDTMMTDRNAVSGEAFDTIEVSVPWNRASECASEMERVLGTFADRVFLHFSHAYQSGACFYSLVWLRAESDSAVLARLRSVWKAALDTASDFDGEIGHHHGIGAARAARYIDSADGWVHVMIKKSLDPSGTMCARLLQKAGC